METITIDVNILLTIIAIAIPVIVILARHFIKKESCFTRMETRLNQLEKDDNDSDDIHDGHGARISKMENDVNEIKIYLRLLLDKEGIPYKKD